MATREPATAREAGDPPTRPRDDDGEASTGNKSVGRPGGDKGEGQAPRRPRRGWYGIAVGVLVLLSLGVGLYWYAHRTYESTDDAFIDGDAVPISPRISGTVQRIFITDNQLVAKDDPLVEIDPRDYQVALDQARAQLAQAEAKERMAQADLALTRASTAAALQLARSGLLAAQSAVEQARARAAADQAEVERAQRNLPRYENLAKAGAASRESLDQVVATERSSMASWRASRQAVDVAVANVAEAQARLAQAETAPQQIAAKEAELGAASAQVASARAAVEQAKLNLSYTKIDAPAAGHITKRSVNSGDVVQRDQALASLVFGQPWITANFKETQLTHMRPGQPVEIKVDAYPGQLFRGHVDSIQRGTGARFSLLPAENATGNYVKVVQRVPVKIIFDRPPDSRFVLGLGLSVVPTVNVGVQGDVQARVATGGPAAAVPSGE